MHSDDTKNRTRTVRELGGEIYAEMFRRIPTDILDWKVADQIVDLAMGVLARHAGTTIENDADFPVTPLPDGGKDV